MSKERFEILESPSELRLRVFGKTLADLFLHALQAMFESTEPRYAPGELLVSHDISLTCAHRDLLMIDFLAQAVALSDIHNEAYFDVRFHELNDRMLNATVIGKKVLGFAVEIKAVTHHDVHIVEKDGQLVTDLLLDI